MRFWGDRFDRVREASCSGDRTFIHSSDDEHELYDLKADPAEERSLLQDAPKATREQVQRPHASRPRVARRRPTEGDTAPLSDQEMERLRALGCVE